MIFVVEERVGLPDGSWEDFKPLIRYQDAGVPRVAAGKTVEEAQAIARSFHTYGKFERRTVIYIRQEPS